MSVAGMDLKIRVFPSGYIQTNAYLISDLSRKEAVLIDAPHFVVAEIAPALAEDGCTLVAALLTHGHYDHIGAAAEAKRSGARLYGHAADRTLFENPRCMLPYAYPPSIELEGFAIDEWVEDGQELTILGLACEVRHVPGHCPGNVLFYFPELEMAFVGDALFAGGVGRTDLPGGSMATLERSIRERIYTLPPATQVLSGHGPGTTVGDEMETNPYVAA